MPENLPQESPKAMVPDRRHGPPTIIHASLMRSGTMSMARAYDKLGFRAYHGLDMTDREFDEPGGWGDWIKMERLAEDIWPEVRSNAKDRGQPPRKVTKDDWNDLYGEFDVITDLGCYFTEQLIDAYPDAKVVLTKRNFDSWWHSFETQVLDSTWHPANYVIQLTVAPLANYRATPAMRKMLFGSSATANLAEFKAQIRQYYDDYYDMVREKVSADRLLEYNLGDGWEPLCRFLERPVPGEPFPRVNDSLDHEKRIMRIVRKLFGRALARLVSILSFGLL